MDIYEQPHSPLSNDQCNLQQLIQSIGHRWPTLGESSGRVRVPHVGGRSGAERTQGQQEQQRW
jgi:hypothetical protein